MTELETKEIRSIQLKCLEILEIIDSICKKYNIKYSLCGGSVVGAHLYQGCLPWDDDIDLMMTRPNYNKFISVCREELPVGFIIQNYQCSDEYYTLFTKIINQNTTLIQEMDDGSIIKSGVFVDITVYDKIPNNKIIRGFDIFLWKLSQWCLIGKVDKRGIKNILRNKFVSLMGVPSTRYYNFLQTVLEKNDRVKNYTYSEIFGSFCNTKPYDKEIFENYTTINFEESQYMIVRDYVRYLECRYDRTDFREPKERQVPSHYSYVDLKKSYLDFEEYTFNKKFNKE